MPRSVFLLFFSLVVLLSRPIHAQGTKADYERANAFRELTRNKIFRDKVDPQWEPDGHRLWYRVATAKDAWEFVVVDAEQGTRELAFDHAAVAEQLSKETGKELQADRLSLEDLRFVADADSLEFRVDSQIWRLNRDDGQLSKREKFAPVKKAAKESKESRPARPQPRRGRRENAGGRVSPDGNWRVFVRDHKLHRQPRRDGGDHGDAMPLSTGSPANSYRDDQIMWSPDSKRVVALRARAGDEHIVKFVESSPSDQLQPKLHEHSYLKPGDEIPQSKPHLFDVANGV